jgi:hypothetical protein
MVSNVAVESVEWAGRGIPNVCHRRCEFLIVVQREPTPDCRQAFFGGTYRLPVIQEFLKSIHTSRLQY